VQVLGIVGGSGSGKTTLITALVPRLAAHGLSVSVVKHAHHGFDIDRPGKDSFRHREAGAREVLVASPQRWALLCENRDAEPPLATLLARLAPVDLVLVEGFKSADHAQLEVHRPSLGRPRLGDAARGILAVATDAPSADAALPELPLNDPDAIAAWILAWWRAR